MSKYILINHSDYYRVLLTETIPFETPIIFSNEGFYRLFRNKEELHNHERIKKIIDIFCGFTKPSKPFKYKIYKRNNEFRTLSLIHPASQLKLASIYENFDNLILYYCSKSKASIRFPKKVASKYYYQSSATLRNLYKYRGEGVSSSLTELHAIHVPSYFSYGGFDRLYKFFESKLFIDLEKKYKNLKTIDISKCFENIYTHSISWAVKNKNVIKNNLRGKKSYFGDEFDSLIRDGNHNETHGIPIGQEVSRIFAEIILQKVDNNIINKLSDEDIIYGRDYIFKRYVDDYYIFYNNVDIDYIYMTIVSELSEYNLHINKSKVCDYVRPFVTNKTKSIIEIKEIINELMSLLFEDYQRFSSVKKIINYHSIFRSFIDKIKVSMDTNKVSFEDMNAFIVAVFSKRIRNIIDVYESNVLLEDKRKISDILMLLVEIIFYYYEILPSANNSYSISACIIMLVSFFKDNLPEFSKELELHYINLVTSCIENMSQSKECSIEALNLLLSTKCLSSDLHYSPKFIKFNFIDNKRINYFGYISLLRYFENNERYEALKSDIVEEITKSFKDQDHILSDSEKTHLFLDFMFCPYISREIRRRMYNRIVVNNNGNGLMLMESDNDGINDFFNFTDNNFFFTNWGEINLYNLLLKRELRKVY
ncbi:antiviral reverse transcriptase Drt3b [Actinobacillus equuli]|uniref:antiviral reverse transcriptase Drt3b n=1 Tax=Actinobacillus equuli TaxID=718 RepID=UPI002442A08C|nr:antiviral reverse transcriptase Drt3b [Actinobacillus equuli]WGE56890.1 RNA-directed DNA polymerase [Actinobacillus equuli subsp. equuli]